MRLELYKDLSAYQPLLLGQTPRNNFNTQNRGNLFEDDICANFDQNRNNNCWNSEDITAHVTPVLDDIRPQHHRSHSSNDVVGANT